MKHLPNAITLLNVLFGSFAVIALTRGQVELGILLVFLGGVADYIDGFVARLTGFSSELGKQLDSLADMVSFGLVPGLILYLLVEASWQGDPTPGLDWRAAPAFLVTVFSGLRLGRFNLDTRQSADFIGLPTPAATLLVIGLLLIHEYGAGSMGWLFQPAVLYAFVLLISGLLVSEIPVFSMKFRGFSWQGNEFRYLLLLVSLLAISLLGYRSLAVIMLAHLLLSLVRWFFLRGDPSS